MEIVCGKCNHKTYNYNCIKIGEKFKKDISKTTFQYFSKITFVCEKCGNTEVSEKQESVIMVK